MRRSGRIWLIRTAVCLLCCLCLTGCVHAEMPEGVRVPILLYHHFSERGDGVTPETFELHMRALSEAGYEAVTVDQLVGYVEGEEELPERPVCITMDDGYLSNYETAWPVLERYDMKATIFLIGSSVGHTEHYKDTEHPITPHFSWEQGREMVDSGVIDLQCHTYDMHQWAPYETGDKVRENALPLEGESEQAYTEALVEDIEAFQSDYERELGRSAYVFAYPGGQCSERSEEIVHSQGFSVTVTSDASRENWIFKGDPESLYRLGRENIEESVTAEELLQIVEDA